MVSLGNAMTGESEPKCFACGKLLGLSRGNVGREETCLNCGADVRVCFNCRHYDASSYNECAEPMAERVVAKDRRNFCDYFSLAGAGGKGTVDPREDARKKLDALFKR